MEKVLVNSAQGESGIVNVVRYFLNNNNEYLIYSLNEVDESGYTRLYVTKLNGMNGAYTGEILDDNEWNEVKNLVKVIVKANKEGMPVPVQDLNPKKITNITLKDKKVFKLNAPLVNDLSNNKNYVEDGTSTPSFDSQPQNFGMPNAQPDFNMPSTPSYEQQTSSFDMPNTSPFDMPQAPQQDYSMPTQGFDMSNTPNFGMPNAQPDFNMTSTPSYEQQTPSFDIPNTQPYDMSNMKQPSPFDMPQAPQQDYGMPNQGFDMSNTPNFGMPNAQPDFNMPSTPSYEQQTPSFDIPNTQPYDMSNMKQPSPFEMPQQNQNYGMPSTPSYEMPNMNQEFNKNNNLYGSMSTDTNDYKAKYDEEVSKNTKLQEEINKLNEEINKYKSIVNNIKNVIE